ncbi:MAG: hypothetical protein J7539_17265 [Niabella sp.]|nr:hypothetical protein [Niabella sp.]
MKVKNTMKKMQLGIILISLLYSCYGQGSKQLNSKEPENSTLMIKDTFDVSDFKKNSKDGVELVHKDYDGNEIRETGAENVGFYKRIKFQNKPFIEGFKEYSPKGVLMRSGKLFGSIAIGTWDYYDDSGHLVKQIDEDKKFGKFGPEQVILFLQKKGLVDTAGNGFGFITSIKYETSEVANIAAVRKDRPDTPDKGQWSISYCKSLPNCDHTFIIDGETGHLISHRDVLGKELIK